MDLTSAKESVVRLINNPSPAKLANLLSILSPDWVDATVTVPNSGVELLPQIRPLIKIPNPMTARGMKIFKARHHVAGLVPIRRRKTEMPKIHILMVKEWMNVNPVAIRQMAINL